MNKFFKIGSREYFILGIALFGIGVFLLGGVFVYVLLHPEIEGYNTAKNENLSLTPLSESDKLFSDERLVIEDITDESVYASSRGSKYYTRFCTAGKSLSEENKIWFADTTEAEDAGYTLAKGCQ